MVDQTPRARTVSYDKNPPAPVRFHEDHVDPPVPQVLVWPSLVMLVTGGLVPDPEETR
jgi:hypothetical protein